MQDVLDVALLVAEAIEAAGDEYFVGGCVASSLQGEPRATNDIDFVVAMLGLRVRAFAEKLGSNFEIDQAPSLAPLGKSPRGRPAIRSAGRRGAGMGGTVASIDPRLSQVGTLPKMRRFDDG